MSNTRSVTPPLMPINANIIKNVGQHLNHGEFPMYNKSGTLNCPPAPPRNTKEIRVCHSCRQTYQIELKTAPLKKCGFCTTNN
jgi:hypothetical protein